MANLYFPGYVLDNGSEVVYDPAGSKADIRFIAAFDEGSNPRRVRKDMTRIFNSLVRNRYGARFDVNITFPYLGNNHPCQITINPSGVHDVTGEVNMASRKLGRPSTIAINVEAPNEAEMDALLQAILRP
jgi:hypothetical protein